MDSSTRPPVKHLGKKIGRIREMLGMKQEILAEKIGISQQSVSKLEQSETIEEATLERVANALGITKEAIKNFNDDLILNLIQHNTYNDSSVTIANFQCTFNPLDEVRKLNAEKEELYKALLRKKRRLLCWSGWLLSWKRSEVY